MDVHRHGVAFDGAAAAIHRHFQLVAADGVAHALHQRQQRVIFMRAQADFLAASLDDAARGFQHHVAATQRGHHAVAAASKHGTQAGQQFVQLKGLDQVIVGARVQPLDAFAQAVARGDDQYGGGIETAAQGLQQRQPAAGGQAQVQQHGVVAVVHQRQLRLGQGACPVHVGPVFGQARTQGIAKHGIVFDKQDTHAHSRAPPGTARRGLKEILKVDQDNAGQSRGASPRPLS
ncbi:hypothetical protein D3C73_850830 [compost metagenome]